MQNLQWALQLLGKLKTILGYNGTNQITVATAKFGDASNYSQFEADGTLKAVGNATVWEDINIPIINLRGGATAPGFKVLASTGIYVSTFDGTGASVISAHGSMEILHSYKEGSDIVPHIHWSPTTVDAGNVRWQLEYVWIAKNGTISASTTIGVTVAVSGVANQIVRTDLGTISGVGMAMSSRFIFRLFRDPVDVLDTYAHDVNGFDFGVHFEKDTIGSRQIDTK